MNKIIALIKANPIIFSIVGVAHIGLIALLFINFVPISFKSEASSNAGLNDDKLISKGVQVDLKLVEREKQRIIDIEKNKQLAKERKQKEFEESISKLNKQKQQADIERKKAEQKKISELNKKTQAEKEAKLAQKKRQ